MPSPHPALPVTTAALIRRTFGFWEILFLLIAPLFLGLAPEGPLLISRGLLFLGAFLLVVAQTRSRYIDAMTTLRREDPLRLRTIAGAYALVYTVYLTAIYLLFHRSLSLTAGHGLLLLGAVAFFALALFLSRGRDLPSGFLLILATLFILPAPLGLAAALPIVLIALSARPPAGDATAGADGLRTRLRRDGAHRGVAQVWTALLCGGTAGTAAVMAGAVPGGWWVSVWPWAAAAALAVGLAQAGMLQMASGGTHRSGWRGLSAGAVGIHGFLGLVTLSMALLSTFPDPGELALRWAASSLFLMAAAAALNGSAVMPMRPVVGIIAGALALAALPVGGQITVAAALAVIAPLAQSGPLRPHPGNGFRT